MADPIQNVESAPSPAPPVHRVREVALLYLRLGFTAFGGPAAHMALIEDEVVRRRKWMDRQHFLDVVATLNFIPGPNSTQLAIQIGLIRAGWRGLIAAGACFILPAMLITIPIAWAYVLYGSLPQIQQMLVGINAVVIALVAAAMVRFGKTAFKDSFTCMVGAVGAVVYYQMLAHHLPQPEIVVLAISALAGIFYYAPPRVMPMLSLPLLAAAEPNAGRDLLRMTLMFLKIGATLFGSGYVVVSYLRTGLLVEHHWMNEQQIATSVAIGQFTPGPLLTAATFVGFVLGKQFTGNFGGALLGAVLATWAIFFPSFVLVGLVGPVLPRIRKHPRARGAFDGMNAAVVALGLVVALKLAQNSLVGVGWLNPVLAIVSLAVLLIWNLNSTWLILGGAIVSLASWYIRSRHG